MPIPEDRLEDFRILANAARWLAALPGMAVLWASDASIVKPGGDINALWSDLDEARPFYGQAVDLYPRYSYDLVTAVGGGAGDVATGYDVVRETGFALAIKLTARLSSDILRLSKNQKPWFAPYPPPRLPAININEMNEHWESIRHHLKTCWEPFDTRGDGDILRSRVRRETIALVGPWRPPIKAPEQIKDGPAPVGKFFWEGREIELQPTPWKVLNCVWGGNRYTRAIDDLYDIVWAEKDPSKNALDSALCRINAAFLSCSISLTIGRKDGFVVLELPNSD